MSERIRIRIVMQTENCEEERHDEDDREYRRVEFHMVDLKGEGLVDLNGGEDKETELHRNWLPPLLSRIGAGAMLASGQSIFIVGGVGGLDESIEESLASLKPPPERRHLYYKGCSKINLLNQQQIQMWHPLPYTKQSPVCFSLLGKLYNFGKWYISPQVFDPSCVEGCWKDLPLPGLLHHDSKRSIPLVADPSNRRILVHSSSTLYAFYPEDKNDDDDDEGGKWECLDDAFSSWTEVVTLAADDLLFLHDCYPAIHWQ